MNPFLASAAALMAGGSVWAGYHHNWKMAVVYACYAVANFCLGRLG